MEVVCTKCKRIVSIENVNVQKDTAFCDTCGEIFSLSRLVATAKNTKFDSSIAIKGASFVDKGSFWIVEVSHRSLQAVFLVPFTLVWAGFSLSGIYGSQIVSGEFDPGASLFGIPFLIGSVFLIELTLMSLFGKSLVSVENSRGLVFMGIGSIGWYRRFNWDNVSEIIENHGEQYRSIALEGAKRITFGWGLSEEQTYYMANILRTKKQ